jgi:hypothetical protein
LDSDPLKWWFKRPFPFYYAEQRWQRKITNYLIWFVDDLRYRKNIWKYDIPINRSD